MSREVVFRNSYLEILADGSIPVFSISSGGHAEMSEGFVKGWHVSCDSVIDALIKYRDNGYQVKPKTVEVPLTEITAMKERIAELEKLAK